MLFSSNVFIFAFLPLVLLVYYVVLHRRAARNVFLMLASLFFYAWGEPRFVLVMLLSILANWGFGLWVARAAGPRRQKWVLALMVAFNLGILFVFKYLNFALKNLGYLFGPAVPQTHIALPIGISFFTFQAMSYVFDVHRNRAPMQKNPLYVALYVSFFPQLIAGPIVRYETIARQIGQRQETFADFSEGVKRFIVGLGKKVLIANQMAAVADAAFGADPVGRSAAFALLGALAYSFQIFFDFAGYSDMAIGLGRMFGFHFLENFDYPYISRSVSEFWRRWHISLGTWFRDYVYFPLGGSRVKSRGRLVLNLLVVWMLTGIWHGAAWNFAAWGLLYFALITFEKLTGWPACFGHGWQRGLWRVFTLLCVYLGWVLFRAESLGLAVSYVAGFFGLNGNPLVDDVFFLFLREQAVFFAAAVLFSTPVAPALARRLAEKWPRGKTAFEVAASVGQAAVLVLCVAYLVKGTHNPFIYFNF